MKKIKGHFSLPSTRPIRSIRPIRPIRPIKLALRARPAFGLLVRLMALDPEGTL